MTASLVAIVLFTEVMAAVICAMACSLVSDPLLRASTTSLKSLTTVTSILYLSRVPSSSQELKKTGVASNIAPANRIDLNVLIVVCFWVIIYTLE